MDLNKSDILRTKSSIFGLFAQISSSEPTIEFLNLLQEEKNRLLFEDNKLDLFADIKDLSLEKQQEAIAVEFTSLFLLPGTTSPRESVQLGEKQLWGNSTVEVNKLYNKFGFKLDDKFKDTPDHISVEIEFICKLLDLEDEYSQRALTEAETGVLQVKKHFLENHLLKWFPGFRDEIMKKSRLYYYKNITIFLDKLLKAEVKELKEVEDIYSDDKK